MMTEYLVQWEIETDADSPEEAVLNVIGVMLDPTSTATYFRVVDKDHDEVLFRDWWDTIHPQDNDENITIDFWPGSAKTQQEEP